MHRPSITRYFLAAIIALFAQFAKAQNYCNEWIDFNKVHVKVKILDQGIYRIAFYDLETAFGREGVSLSTIGHAKLRMYNKGKQIPLYINLGKNNVFDGADYLEFYGEMNNGEFDAKLYDSAHWQPHQYNPMYEDSNIYYISYRDTGVALRLNLYSQANAPVRTPKPYHWSSVFYAPEIQYFGGQRQIIVGKPFYKSEYTEGESFAGEEFGVDINGNIRNFATNLKTPFAYNNNVPSKLEYAVLGNSQFGEAKIQAVDHEFEVGVGNSNTPLTTFTKTQFFGFSMIRKTQFFNTSNIQPSFTYVFFTPKKVPLTNYSQYQFSFANLTYPKQNQLDGVSQYVFNESKSTFSENYSWINYGSASRKTPIVYDFGSNKKLFANYVLATGDVNFHLPPRDSGRIVIVDSMEIKQLSDIDLHGFKFTNFDNEFVDKTEYLFISNHVLAGISRTELYPEVEEYLNYWKTQKLAPKLAFTDEIFDAFGYGFFHPMAIKNFTKYLYEKSTTFKPKYMLLMGRGYETRFMRGPDAINLKNNGLMKINHIPVMGVPASDNMFTSGYAGSKWEPLIGTGRIAVDSTHHIGYYLEKVKSYTSPTNLYQEWQKHVLHLGGGATDVQNNIIAGILNNLKRYVENPPFAGIVHTYNKSAAGTTTINVAEKVTQHINSGVSLITFLGHGSNTTTDIDIGNPDWYLNKDKYFIGYFNGCDINQVCRPYNPLSQPVPYAEKFVKVRNRGAIAFIAPTDYTELFMVSNQMDFFYQSYFDTATRLSLGDVMRNHIKQYQQFPGDLRQMHARQLFLLGDPALPVYIMPKPDYAVNNQSMFITPGNTIALSDSFKLGVIVHNLGRATKDSFTIDLERIYPDPSIRRNYQIKGFSKKFIDTFYFTIKSKDILTQGDNYFNIHINKGQNPEEGSYANNIATWKTYMPGNGSMLISPPKFAIIDKDSVELVVQAANILKEFSQYVIEIDTNPYFTSNAKRAYIGQNRVLISKMFKLNPQHDTQMYFWRARIKEDSLNGGAWSTSTFTYVKKHNNGWWQNQRWQYNRPASFNVLHNIQSDSASNHFVFTPIYKKIWCDCQSGWTSNLGCKEAGFGSQDLNYGVESYSGLVAMIWNNFDLERNCLDPAVYHKPTSFWGRAWKCYDNPYNYQVYWDWTLDTKASCDDFVKFIDAVPDSFYVTIYSRRSCNSKWWTPEVYNALHKIGSYVMDEVNNNPAIKADESTVFVCIGQKGKTGGKIVEAYTRGWGNWLGITGNMTGYAASGWMNSELCGPSLGWDKVYFTNNFKPYKGSDSSESLFGVKVIGLNSVTGKEDLLFAEKKSPIDISSVDYKKYKQIYLRMENFDRIKHRASNMANWRVTYSKPPEGTLFTDRTAGFFYTNDTAYEGDTIDLRIPFKNISNLKFTDSLKVNYTVINKTDRKVIYQISKKFQALDPDSQFIFKHRILTTGLNGKYSISISVNPGFLVPEQTLINNSLTMDLYVIKDVVNPILDVTFDGRHIINGDIVSANPFILISSKDENKFILQKDTNNIILELDNLNDALPPIKIKMGNEAIFFAAKDKNNKARVEFRPQNLASGDYILKVQSIDAQGNKAAQLEYQIQFKVDREMKATHFYPYPNPFTSKMRFVFTLTGTEVPDEIRISIMNAEGRVVKEVTKEELGNVRIGTNITDWYWDGKDQYGDALGNGTYFYRVYLSNKGKDVKLMETAGDKTFKEQVGTIYLMR